MATCDVAIVGAGPGGGAAACRLAETGLRVQILDQQALPRAKACGGAMPGAIVKDIDWPIDHLIKARVARQRFLYDHSADDRIVHMAEPMILVDRASFDADFVTRALRAGKGRVILRQNTRVTDVCEDETGVTLGLQGGATLSAQYVIASDGASSRVARCLGLYEKPQGAGIDSMVQTSAATFSAEHHRVTFNLHCVPSGYGWIFPKDDHLSCGVGMWRDPANLSRAMDDFLDRSLPPGDIRHQHRLAHPVPVFAGHRTIASRRVCLVGDAAHLVDPILGEGIKYAIQSGKLAADVVLQLSDPGRAAPTMDTGTDASFQDILARHKDCGAYGEIIRYTIARKLNLIRLREEAFFSDPAAVYQTVMA